VKITLDLPDTGQVGCGWFGMRARVRVTLVGDANFCSNTATDSVLKHRNCSKSGCGHPMRCSYLDSQRLCCLPPRCNCSYLIMPNEKSYGRKQYEVIQRASLAHQLRVTTEAHTSVCVYRTLASVSWVLRGTRIFQSPGPSSTHSVQLSVLPTRHGPP
jgi:hypothetical protein